MGIPVAATAKNYSASGADNVSKFIPEIWSGKLATKFYESTVFGEIANTDYEGEIKSHGDKVYIRTRPTITIRNYTKGAGLTYEDPESPNKELTIDQAKYFGFNAYEVDRIQSDINLLNEWSDDASSQMKISVDTDILGTIYTQAHASNKGATAGLKSSGINLGTTAAPVALTKANVLDVMVDCATVLDEQSVPDEDRWILLPPRMCGLIKKSDLKDASITGDSVSPLRNGRLGSIDRFTIYSSNNLSSTGTRTEIPFGHKSALTFAAQATQVEQKDNPNDFGKRVCGLNVFGFEVVTNQALGHLVASM